MIELPQDFSGLLVGLADAGAEFVVLGGHAVAFHGHPRATKDLDVLVRANPANAARADGITFDEAVAARDAFEIEGRRVPVIGFEALLRNKRAANRAQDVAALEAPRRGSR